YTVKSGDTLAQISRTLKKRGVSASVDEIRALNRLATNSLIKPGQVLQIPQGRP
ncbi:MAG TPA: peptidoglycan-binding protein LysM, partial [Verrucomicrobiales bacterium]|nr:peptidoglycan-binding protein LysM [Verrucomicrobiales bacterium]